jgi:hypothetical protein
MSSSSVRSERAIAPLLIVAAAAPVVVATARAMADHWQPVADQGIVATRAFDVFSSHAPLVGQYSLASDSAGHVTHSPGPLLYWLLALPARIGAPVSLTLTIAVVNVAAIAGTLVLARRLGGTSLMTLVAAGLLLMSRSLAPESLHDLFNPSVPLFGFALLVFVCWSLALGEHRLAPLAVVLASFVAQCHLAFVLPAAGMLAVGAFGLRRAPRPWLVATVAVFVVCWSAPLADEIAHRPGNLSLLATAAISRKHTLGANVGWRAVSEAIGVVPRWLREPQSHAERLSGISGGDYGDSRLDDVLRGPSAVRSASTLALLSALAVALAAGLRRRRAELAAGAAIALVLCGSLAVVAASTPARSLNTLGYTLWWGSVAGMCAWIVLAWGGGLRVPERLLPAGAVAIAVAAVAIVLAMSSDAHRPMYRSARALAERAVARVPPGRTVLVESENARMVAIQPAVMFALRRHGVHPLGAALRLGPWYALDHRRYATRVTLR